MKSLFLLTLLLLRVEAFAQPSQGPYPARGGGGMAGNGFPLTSNANANTFSITNLASITGSNGASVNFNASSPASTVTISANLAVTNANGALTVISTGTNFWLLCAETNASGTYFTNYILLDNSFGATSITASNIILNGSGTSNYLGVINGMTNVTGPLYIYGDQYNTNGVRVQTGYTIISNAANAVLFGPNSNLLSGFNAETNITGPTTIHGDQYRTNAVTVTTGITIVSNAAGIDTFQGAGDFGAGGKVSGTNGLATYINNKASLLTSNVGTGTWSFTNTDVVNWQCFIGGLGACAVQGVSLNDSKLFVGNSTNILATLVLQPSEWLRITNTTAPGFSFKRL